MKISKFATFTAAALVAGGVFAEEAAPAAAAEKAPAPAVEAKAADEVSVLIGGTVKIMKSEIDARMADFVKYSEQMGRPVPADQLAEMRKEMIEGMAMQKALEIAADKANITVSDDDVIDFVANSLQKLKKYSLQLY